MYNEITLRNLTKRGMLKDAVGKKLLFFTKGTHFYSKQFQCLFKSITLK
jgi:hypothetical protein